MLTVRIVNPVLPEIQMLLAGSSIDGQLILNHSSTLVDPVVKVEVMGRGYLRWLKIRRSDSKVWTWSTT